MQELRRREATFQKTHTTGTLEILFLTRLGQKTFKIVISATLSGYRRDRPRAKELPKRPRNRTMAGARLRVRLHVLRERPSWRISPRKTYLAAPYQWTNRVTEAKSSSILT
jgi:hypothetical protein